MEQNGKLFLTFFPRVAKYLKDKKHISLHLAQKYTDLLSNCTKKRTNNAPVEYKYPAVLYGFLDSWFFCTVKNLFKQSTARASFSIRFAFTTVWEMSWKTPCLFTGR